MRIAFLIFDDITALDAIGPFEVLCRIPGAEVMFVGETAGIKRADPKSLGIVADYSIADVTNADILNSINMVEGVYEDELGITFSVVFQHTWATADPYSGTGVDSLLRSVQAYWNVNYPAAQNPRDTMHLWTGKSYALSQGYAFIDVICNHPESAYGLSGKLEWVPAKYEITAHEIGHNLGAVHGEAADGCADTLMNAQLTTSTPFVFCSVSIGQIQSHVSASGGCLSSRNDAATRFDFDGDSKADIGL